jgi:hypothetical protein
MYHIRVSQTTKSIEKKPQKKERAKAQNHSTLSLPPFGNKLPKSSKMHRAKRHCGLLLAASVWVDVGVVRTAAANTSADV